MKSYYTSIMHLPCYLLVSFYYGGSYDKLSLYLPLSYLHTQAENETVVRSMKIINIVKADFLHDLDIVTRLYSHEYKLCAL